MTSFRTKIVLIMNILVGFEWLNGAFLICLTINDITLFNIFYDSTDKKVGRTYCRWWGILPTM